MATPLSFRVIRRENLVSLKYLFLNKLKTAGRAKKMTYTLFVPFVFPISQ